MEAQSTLIRHLWLGPIRTLGTWCPNSMTKSLIPRSRRLKAEAKTVQNGTEPMQAKQTPVIGYSASSMTMHRGTASILCGSITLFLVLDRQVCLDFNQAILKLYTALDYHHVHNTEIEHKGRHSYSKSSSSYLLTWPMRADKELDCTQNWFSCFLKVYIAFC